MSVIDDVSPPVGWDRRPFGRLVTRSKESGRSDLPPLSVYLDDGVVPRSSRDDNYNRLGEDASKYLVVRPGDIVFNKLRTWQGGLGVSRHSGIVSPAYFVCRPHPAMEPRFLHYLLRSRPYLAELTRVSKFMPPSQFDILWDDLREVPVVFPRLPEQQAIANHLDTETARIDALIASKRRLVELVGIRLGSAVDALFTFSGESVPAPRLSTVVSIREGQVDPRLEPYRELPLIAPNHVESGTGRLLELESADEQGAISGKYLCEAGDVIYSKIRPALRKVCVAPTRCLTSADMYPLRSAQGLLPEYLYYFLLSERFSDFAALESERVAMPKINRDAFGRIRIPLPSRKRQREIVEELDRRRDWSSKMRVALFKQIELLRDHRQTLITAAVTGELEIPGVA